MVKKQTKRAEGFDHVKLLTAWRYVCRSQSSNGRHFWNNNSGFSLALRPPAHRASSINTECFADYGYVSMRTCKPASTFSLSLAPYYSLSLVSPPPPPIISNQREPSTSQSNRPATLQPSGTCSHIEKRGSYYDTHEGLQLALVHRHTN